MKNRRIILFWLLIVCTISPAIAEEYSMKVYKSPYCGCCEKWISHLEQNGFKVTSENQENMNTIKSQLGISHALQSCHTGVINGYFIEGHVPARDIKKLLTEKPNIKGLAVPGMPAGVNVPGMETRAETARFDVIAVGENNNKIYTHYE